MGRDLFAEQQEPQTGGRDLFAVEPAAEPMPSTDWLGGIRSALQGATFGSADELGALIAAGVAKATGSEEGIADIFRDIHGTLGEQRQQFADERPDAALALELGGGLVSGGLGAARALGSEVLKRVPRLATAAGVGGLEGATYGALSSDIGERTEGAATGGALGATLGPLADVGTQKLAEIVAPYYRGAADKFGDVVAGGIARAKDFLAPLPGSNARRVLRAQLARENIGSIDELPRGSGGLDLTLADTTKAGENLAAGLATDVDNPAVTRQVEEFFGLRNRQLTGRVFNLFDEALDIPPNATIREAVNAARQRQKALAEPLYAEAAQTPISPTPYMRAVLEGGKGEAAQQWRKAVAATDLMRNAGDDVTAFTVLDEWKKNMDDAYEAAMRQGRKGKARDIVRVKNRVVNEIDEQNPAYKVARDVWGSEQSLISAGERGRKILTEDLDELDEYFATLSDAEKSMYRLGVQKAVRERLMAAREGTNSLNRITSQLNLERFKRIFPDAESFKQFKDAIDVEANAFETYRTLVQNSQTARRKSAQRALEGRYALSMDELPTNAPGMIRRALVWITRPFTGQGLSPRAKAELGRMVLTPLRDLPDSDIRKIERHVVRNIGQEQRQYIEQLFNEIRQPAAVSAGGIAYPAMAEQ